MAPDLHSPPSARPTTSRAGFDPATDAFSERDPQYTLSQQYSVEDDDDEESDEGDVFAFLPPSTAGHSTPATPALPPPQSHIPPTNPPPQASLPPAPYHQYPQYLPTNVTSPISPPPPFSSFADPLSYPPPPTFIPPTPTPYLSEAGPSTTSVHFVGKVDSPSPPSTAEPRDSRSFSAEDGFRLRKLGGLSTALSATTGFTVASAPISLDHKRRSALLPEKRQASSEMSDFSTIDPEVDSTASIKSVYCPPVHLLPLTRPQDEIRF